MSVPTLSQSTLDALADAASLIASHDTGEMFCNYTPHCPLYPGVYGEDAVLYISEGRAHLAACYASQAARAAFRAVPGLREE